MQQNFLKGLLKSDQTIFSFKELLLRYAPTDQKTLKSKLYYYVKQGDLYRVRRGLYAKNSHYDRYEFATKLLTPAYISFESVLKAVGIIFQYYTAIFVASYQSREVICDGQTYIFRTMKPMILTNTAGIEFRKNYSIASPERAFLDLVYLTKHYYFDNLEPLDWAKVYELVPLYGDNKQFIQRITSYHTSYTKGRKVYGA